MFPNWSMDCAWVAALLALTDVVIVLNGFGMLSPSIFHVPGTDRARAVGTLLGSVLLVGDRRFCVMSAVAVGMSARL